MSSLRQRRLAGILFLANLAIGLVSAAIIGPVNNWQLEFSTFQWVCLGFAFGLSWLCLLIAADFAHWAGGVVRRAGSAIASALSEDGKADEPEDPGPEIERLDPHRKYFYYCGVWSNLISLALLTELTGGLAESPFVALYIAFVLTGQQLSRFRRQTFWMLVTGVVVTALMIVLGPYASAPAVAAPHGLTITVVALALAAGALHNYMEKPENYLIKKHVRPPTRARIYLDGRMAWRFTFLENIHRQDPFLATSAMPAAAMNADGDFPEGLKEKFEEYLGVMLDATGWQVESTWPNRCARSFVVNLRVVSGAAD